PTVEEVD
nr:Chain D, Heat shock 70 kDa protein cognate 2 [Drosophila melanogaster]3UPV_B Chain B, Heat shock protein SSA4 [Saccharomyces cerevisiae S288C]5L0Y_I Chain I, PRO-THR-VAL-GLU-GLU-VAL-ASP [Thermochaetoides thermophila]5L0Y_J Chain J, PRO-THR-VAL-GLU-GLU-VAL-ASP [Thermochaetoides thermophila]5L0Y_K Chain K, PRO-THR-VAL-GLU-GLU-VAL-ASP [Thermochaetoides thermophila]5L0Y_L Chain L, PRO-THR-VAL-GLU-GLU-VAL-ASP [Thermochaetoides thermophila]5L0Y_M Chain M, PRO-THR-VAL-GLU-GLU-VAL-ASP [Thermochaet